MTYDRFVVNRLSPRDAMFYFLDESRTTTHLGALLILSPQKEQNAEDAGPKGQGASSNASARSTLDYPSLVTLVENRLQLVPRSRQVVREVTLGLARPVWVDDRDFDINFHIRRAGLPRPGGPGDLADLIARVMSRPLDRTRPLWEMYLIEGLADGKLAILTKSHRCLLDDGGGTEISEVICDEQPEPVTLPEDLWMPGSPPGGTRLLMGALGEALSRPGDLVDTVTNGNGLVSDIRSAVETTVRRVGGVVQQLTDSAPSSPLNAVGTSTRMFITASVPRRGCAKIAQCYGCTVNDVELAIISGVMRKWLLSVDPGASVADTVRVVIPLSARDPGVERTVETDPGWVSVGKPSFVTDLPVGEANPAVRLAQVAGLANRYAQSSRRVSLGPRPLFPALGVVPFPEFSSRAFRSLNSRGYNVPVAMGTTPIADRFLLGHRVDEVFAVPMLVAERALAISVVEYGDNLQFGFIADRGVIGDLPVMADFVAESYEELASVV